MRKIAVVVEGASDEVFWEKVLNREFAQQCRFKVLNRKGRTRVIQSAADFVDSCRRGGYASIFFLVDLDDSPCAAAVRGLFAESVRQAASAVEERVVHICIARREFEAWMLADEEALRAVLPNCGYHCEEPTDSIGAASKLTELLQTDRGAAVGFRKPAFARELAPYFSRQRAIQWSRSFAYFWGKITAAATDPA